MDAKHQSETARARPTFEGWTVDLRLAEFRRAEFDQELEFMPFDSPAGEELLARFLATQGPRQDPA